MKLIGLVVSVFILIGCKNPKSQIPKPKMYFRIDLPQLHHYKSLETSCPYTFEYPIYAGIDSTSLSKTATNCWKDVVITPANARIHLTYKSVNNNLDTYIEDVHTMAYKHDVKADNIEPLFIENADAKVYGLFYNISGNAASPYQFFLTDSNQHFIRGAVYINARSNRDSLSPLIEFVNKDLQHLIQTFHWKK